MTVPALQKQTAGAAQTAVPTNPLKQSWFGRWTLFDAIRFNVKMDPGMPMTTCEPAVSSPIWYAPERT